MALILRRKRRHHLQQAVGGEYISELDGIADPRKELEGDAIHPQEMPTSHNVVVAEAPEIVVTELEAVLGSTSGGQRQVQGFEDAQGETRATSFSHVNLSEASTHFDILLAPPSVSTVEQNTSASQPTQRRLSFDHNEEMRWLEREEARIQARKEELRLRNLH